LCMPTTDVQPRPARSKSARTTAALIAAEELHDAIAQVLQDGGLETKTFDRVEDVLDDATAAAPSVAVVCVEDISPSLLARILRPLAQHFEQTPVVVVCPGPDRWRWGIRTALSMGAAGIVLRDELESTLDPCLHAVLAGQTCVPQAHSREIEPPALSSREKQILGLVVMGYMNSQIAERLFLAESTIKSHLSSAFAKLGVRSRHEAVDLIVDPDGGLGLGILGLGGEPIKPTAGLPAKSAGGQR
jgi:DNA-binding NarL/FixJ family response regulator